MKTLVVLTANDLIKDFIDGDATTLEVKSGYKLYTSAARYVANAKRASSVCRPTAWNSITSTRPTRMYRSPNRPAS